MEKTETQPDVTKQLREIIGAGVAYGIGLMVGKHNLPGYTREELYEKINHYLDNIEPRRITDFVKSLSTSPDISDEQIRREAEAKKLIEFVGKNFVCLGNTWAYGIEDSKAGTYGVRLSAEQVYEKYKEYNGKESRVSNR